MTYTSLFVVLVFSVVMLFHSALLPVIQVVWNYEFTKVCFFIVLTSLFSTFFIWKKKFSFSPLFLFFLWSIFVSTFFSASPILSFIGWQEKGHGFFLFFSLFLFTNICFHLSEEERKYIKKALFYLLVFTCFIALKERFFPSYDYGELSKRALWTLWSPNYLSGAILLFVPFLLQSLERKRSIFLALACVLIFFTLFLTFQWWAIFLFLWYVFFSFWRKYSNTLKLVFFGLLFIVAWILLFLFPEKLHSFLSRFWIWETTFHIIFSSPKVFFFWVWPEMLGNIFSSYKIPSLYIYENFWFTADRVHNIFLDFWVQFWLFPFLLLVYATYFLFRNYKKNPSNDSLILFVLFQLYNFPSAITYLLCIFLITWILPKEKSTFFHSLFSRVLLSSISLLSIVFISFLYFTHVDASKGNHQKPAELFSFSVFFPEYKDENFYKSQILVTSKKEENCWVLVQKFPSVENYFFCGDIFKNIGDVKNAKMYYRKGLQKLPDLWNKNSHYWNNFFVSKTITGNRFFSPKFSHIGQILDFLQIPREK